MAYYTKKEVLDYVSENVKEIEAKGLKMLNPEAEVIKRVNDEEDMVGFFWIDFKEGETDGEKIKMEGRSWYKIDTDIYTDDRFAIDLYQAMVNEITISDVIRKRRQEREIAKQGIIDTQKLEEKVKENIKNDGTE
jgi:hypothetical protein